LIRNGYSFLGLGLIIAGAGFTPLSYLVLNSTPLTALGIAFIILGAVSLVLGRARPAMPSEAGALLLEAGLENIGALIEELGLRSKAIYLPSRLAGGACRALIPMQSNPSLPQTNHPLPQRLIVKHGSGPEDLGLLVATPGTPAVNMMETKPSLNGLESALKSVLEGMTDLVDNIRVITTDEEKVTVEISNPRIEYRHIWFYDYLGSPLASMVASISAEALDKPVIISHELYHKGKSTIELEVLA
jgi:hypothetical protein